MEISGEVGFTYKPLIAILGEILSAFSQYILRDHWLATGNQLE